MSSEHEIRRRQRRQNGTRRTMSCSYTVPKKNFIERKASIKSPEVKEWHAVTNKEVVREEGDEILDQVRGYLEDADDYIEDVLERIVNQAENASAKMVHNASEMVHNASEMVHRSKDAVVHNASEMVHRSKHVVSNSVHHAEEWAHDVYLRIRHWKACHFEKLPNWLKDNEHLHFGHRPQLPSFAECFRSIFRIHTETGNIWTHLIGFVAFVIVTIVFYIKPLCTTCQLDINISDKLIFLCFFIGAILCLACSALFHTVCCHSEWVSHVFSRLDYAGIAFLIVGSIIPWLYYGFYCQFYAKLTYIIAISILGVLTIIITMWERFNLPDFRVYRTTTFVALACLSAIPIIHYLSQKGFAISLHEASIHCTIIMGALYLTGALLYAARIPERFLPGKCDIWFQSHQIFHVLVIVAAFVHWQGLAEMAEYRLKNDPMCLKSDGLDIEQFATNVNEDFGTRVGAIY